MLYLNILSLDREYATLHKYCSQCGLSVYNSPSPSTMAYNSPSSSTMGYNSPSPSTIAYDSPSTSMAYNAPSISNNERKTLNFDQYMLKKSKDRLSHTHSKNLKRKRDIENESVNITTGLMESELGMFKPVHGKRVNILTRKGALANEILQSAIMKRKAHDCTFRSDFSYILKYPDRNDVKPLPGSEEEFSLIKYKEDLGKSYSRIILFLYCTTEKEDKSLIRSESDDDDDFLQPKMFNKSVNCPANDTSRSSVFTPPTSLPKDLDTKLRCPICNELVSLSVIEVHADECAIEKENKMSFVAFENFEQFVEE